MKVSLKIYGGLAGALGRLVKVVSTDDLDEDEKRELHRLVAAACVACSAAVSHSAGGVRDGQTYEIEIDGGGDCAVLEAIDGSVPEEFAALRNWLCSR